MFHVEHYHFTLYNYKKGERDVPRGTSLFTNYYFNNSKPSILEIQL